MFRAGEQRELRWMRLTTEDDRLCEWIGENHRLMALMGHKRVIVNPDEEASGEDRNIEQNYEPMKWDGDQVR